MILALVVRTRRTNSMEETSKLQFFVVVEDFLSQRFHTHALLPSIYYLPTYSLQSSYSYTTTCFVSNRIAGNLSSAFHNSEFSIRSGIVLLLDDAWRIMPCRNLIQGISRWIWGYFCFSFFYARPFSLHIFSTFLNDCGNGWGTKTDAIVGF